MIAINFIIILIFLTFIFRTFCFDLFLLNLLAPLTNCFRFGLQDCWSMNKYILNLAIADLLYSTVNMPVLALQYLYHGWYRSKSLCLFFGSLLVVITYAEWMFLAIIALKKCVHLIKPRLGDLIFSGVTGSTILVLIWIYALLVVAFLHFKVKL